MAFHLGAGQDDAINNIQGHIRLSGVLSRSEDAGTFAGRILRAFSNRYPENCDPPDSLVCWHARTLFPVSYTHLTLPTTPYV